MTLSKTHIIHGLKTGLATVMAYAITNQLNLEFGYWAVISSVIVMQIYVADSVELCLYRFSGTTLGALLGILVLEFIPRTPFPIAFALFLTSGVCSFLTRYKTQYRMAAITFVIVVLSGIHSENAVAYGLSRILEIFIGIACAFIVSILISPKRRVDVLRENLISQAHQCQDNCRILVGAFTARQRNVDEHLMESLLKSVGENHMLLQKTRRHEALIYQKKFNNHFANKVILMGRCVDHLHAMLRSLNALQTEGFDIIMARELKALAQSSTKTLISLMGGAAPGEIHTLEQRVADLDTKIIHLRKEGKTRRFDSRRLIQIFSFYSSLLYLAQDILEAAQKNEG